MDADGRTTDVAPWHNLSWPLAMGAKNLYDQQQVMLRIKGTKGPNSLT